MNDKAIEIQTGDNRGGEIKEIAPRYQVRKKGALNYIFDESGRQVSDGYHDFEVYREEEGDATVLSLLGKKGSQKYVLHIPVDETEKFDEVTKGFHDLKYRSDLGGLFVVQSGAMKHILDSKTGEKSEKGYHSIFQREGVLYGELGSKTERIGRVPKKLSGDVHLALE